MAENNFGKGIKITSGFDLNAKLPLDNRTIVNTIEERNAHVTNNRAYEGMRVYVLNEKKEYRFNGTNWDDLADVDIEKIESSEVEPTDENVSIWINTSEDISIDTVPKINDEIVANDTTWSSEKIYSSIVYGSSGGAIDLSDYALKMEIPTKVSQLMNDKNYLSSIPSEYVTEQELANTNTTLNKLNEQYSNLSGKYNELSEKIENSGVDNDKLEELDARCDILSVGHNELLGKITTLEINNKELKEQYNELSTDQDELLEIVENIEKSVPFRELKEQYDELSASHNELLERTEVLENDNETLKTRYNNLSIGHNELLERHNTLSSEHSKLSRKHDELSAKVTSLENITIGEMTEKYNLLVIRYESLLDKIEELEQELENRPIPEPEPEPEPEPGNPDDGGEDNDDENDKTSRIADLNGNVLLDSDSNYLTVDNDDNGGNDDDGNDNDGNDDDGGNDDDSNDETSRIADLNGNTLLDSNSNYLIVDNNDNNNDNNDNNNDNNDNNDDDEINDGTIYYVADKDGYLVLDKNQYKIAFKPSDSTK